MGLVPNLCDEDVLPTIHSLKLRLTKIRRFRGEVFLDPPRGGQRLPRLDD